MNSIYYYIYNSYNLWIKEKLNESIIVIDSLKLKIKKDNNKKFKYRSFVWTEKYLILWNNDKFKAYINLGFIGLDYNNKDQILILFTSKNYFKIYFDNKNNYLKWKSVIKSNSIMNDFHKKYNIIEKKNSINSFYKIQSIKSSKDYYLKIYNKFENDEEINIIDLYKFFQNSKLLINKNLLKIKYIYESDSSFYVIYNYYENINFEKIITINFESKIEIMKELIEGISYIKNNFGYSNFDVNQLFYKTNKGVYKVKILNTINNNNINGNEQNNSSYFFIYKIICLLLLNKKKLEIKYNSEDYDNFDKKDLKDLLEFLKPNFIDSYKIIKSSLKLNN